MKLIIISGPSGSGKTTLSEIIIKKAKDGIILSTDNYYRTDIISKILSKIHSSYFDRKISFNFQLFKRHLEFILENGYSNISYQYEFKNNSIKKIYKKSKKLKFIIVEGIFAQEIFKFLSSKNWILVKLKINKRSCLKRVVKRDYIERGKSKVKAERNFIKAWEIFQRNKKRTNSRKYLEKFVLKNKSEIKNFVNKISKEVNLF